MHCQVLPPYTLFKSLERLVIRIHLIGMWPEHSKLLDGVLLLLWVFLVVLKISVHDVWEDFRNQLVEHFEMVDNPLRVNFIVKQWPQILNNLFDILVSIIVVIRRILQQFHKLWCEVLGCECFFAELVAALRVDDESVDVLDSVALDGQHRHVVVFSIESI